MVELLYVVVHSCVIFRNCAIDIAQNGKNNRKVTCFVKLIARNGYFSMNGAGFHIPWLRTSYQTCMYLIGTQVVHEQQRGECLVDIQLGKRS